METHTKTEERVTLEDLQETHRLIEAGEIVLKCMLTKREVPEDIKRIWESRGKKDETIDVNNPPF